MPSADADLFREVADARSNGADGTRAPPARPAPPDAFLPHQVPAELRQRIVELEASVEARFAQHRGDVGGHRSTTTRSSASSATSDDVAERREAWEASKTVGAAVADDVRELARLRNEAARTLGFRDWFALAIATSEMDETRSSRRSTSATG